MRVGVVLVAAGLGLGPGAGAAAHSLLLESVPAAGTTVAAPRELVLRFNNRIERGLSRLRLVDEGGRAVALTVTVGREELDRLRAGLPELGPGRYRVEWQALSVDGHIVSGVFAFRVGP